MRLAPSPPMLAAGFLVSLMCAMLPRAFGDQPADSPCPAGDDATDATDARRRRPGATAADDEALPCDPSRMPPPREGLPQSPLAMPDRWRLTERFHPVDAADPYGAENPWKGDRPVWGADGFGNLAVTSTSLIEPRRIPITEEVSGSDGARTLTRDETFFSETLMVDAVAYRGDTVFRPPDWQVRVTPAVNFSETQIAGTEAGGGLVAIQGLSFEKHLRDVSSNYDFDSVRVGIQPIVSDFRGFLLSDQPLALRLFGTRDDNVFQYNVALIERVRKDRVRLNDVGRAPPDNQTLLANLYWQDVLAAGTTSEFVVALNRNHGNDVQHVLGQPGLPGVTAVDKAHDYEVAYLGYNLDGHFGRLNTTASVYALGGYERQGTFVDRSTTVRAWFAADELSMDFDWRRARLSLLHASGDGNPYDRRAGGFDTLTSGAVFAGSDASFFFHQRLALSGGLIDLKSRDGFLPSLRGANNSLEADFSNPGLNLIGAGLDLSLTPALTLSLDANQLWFDNTAPLRALLNQRVIPRRIGAEAEADAIWRPFATQNLILRLSASQLVVGPGYRALYAGGNPFSLFAHFTVTY